MFYIYHYFMANPASGMNVSRMVLSSSSSDFFNSPVLVILDNGVIRFDSLE